MPLIATNTSKPRELIPAGNHIARCYSIVEIGHIHVEIKGKIERLHKGRITWELPTELRVFKEGESPKPMVTSKDFILSTSPKAAFRKTLNDWRGVPLTDEQAKGFDVTSLAGAYCLLNITHKQSAKTGNMYDEVSTITPMIKGQVVPAAINPIFILTYDIFDQAKFDSLPEHVKNEMKTSDEYKAMTGTPANGDFSKMHTLAAANANAAKVTAGDDLPF